LTALDLPELEGCWQTVRPSIAGRKIQLDLRGLVGADTAGQLWLTEMAGAKDLELLVSPDSANFLTPGSSVEIALENGPIEGSWVDRMRVRLRTGRKARAPYKPTDAAAQTLP
jgi:hypothetical protein